MTFAKNLRARFRIRRWQAVAFVLPAALLLFSISIFPLIYSLGVSLYNYSLAFANSIGFVGLGNYAELWRDPQARSSVWTTARIGVAALLIELVLGLGLALLLRTFTRGRGVLTTLLVVPAMIAPAAAGMTWRMLYTPNWGPIDHLVGLLTGGAVQIDWLGDGRYAPWAVVIADAWQNTPFVMLILLAGLTAIPGSVLEAARVDGASATKAFLYVVLPLLRPYIAIAAVFRAIDLFKLFDLPFVLTQGGPAGATTTVSVYIYEIGIRDLRVGYGAAASLGLLALVILLTRQLARATRASA
jgi:multiple sugar transport system permease protein